MYRKKLRFIKHEKLYKNEFKFKTKNKKFLGLYKF